MKERNEINLEPTAEEMYEAEAKLCAGDDTIQAIGDLSIVVTEVDKPETVTKITTVLDLMNKEIVLIESKRGKFEPAKFFVGKAKPREITFVGYIIKRPKPLDKSLKI